MRTILNITKALADESRLRLLLALNGRELCVCQLTELLGTAPSTVSKHLSILNNAGLVNSRKTGRWIFYSHPGEDASAPVREAIEWLGKALAGEPGTLRDRQILEEIMKKDPTELCRRQCAK